MALTVFRFISGLLKATEAIARAHKPTSKSTGRKVSTTKQQQKQSPYQYPPPYPRPVLTASMLIPKEGKFTIADAKRNYKAFMRHIKFHSDSEDLAQSAEYFVNNWRDMEEELKEELDNARIELNEINEEHKKIKNILKECDDECEKESLSSDLEDCKEELDGLKESYEELKINYEQYKSGLRIYLISEVNTEVHGRDWREKFGIQASEENCLPSRDSHYWRTQLPTKVNVTLQFEYTDSEGEETKRIVDVERCGFFRGGIIERSMIFGYCRMRNATRTFDTDNMKKCVDFKTGENVKDVVSYLESIRQPT